MPDLINGRTPEEIRKGLECCTEEGVITCDDCPYHGEGRFRGCKCLDLRKDALALIRQLERERDALAKTMKLVLKDLDVGVCCETCSHYAYDEDDESSICADCDVDSNWQWRGVQEVE